jgi:aspartyl-tRNA(Asn)/glutamyl-tRNA(Gln) amidotransferase subunit C
VRAAAIAPLMSVDTKTVRHIAKLARLQMADAEVEALVPELNNILGWIEQLGEVNTGGVEPLTAVVDQRLRLRDDVVNDGDCRDAVLANAPEAQHGFFAVPKVIE